MITQAKIGNWWLASLQPCVYQQRHCFPHLQKHRWNRDHASQWNWIELEALTYIAAYLLMVLNLIIQNDSVGFLWRQPGQAHGARCGRHQVNCGHCRWSYTGQNKERKIRFIYRFLCYVFSSYMPFVCPQKPKYKVLGCGLCEKLWPIVSMQNHSPLMLKFSLPESSGRERGCLILLWQENQTAKLMDRSLVHAVPSTIHQL